MVLQRTREIGIRMAMGAQSLDVMRMVIGQNMRLALTGIVVGVSIAVGLTWLLAKLLFDVSPNDPVTFLTVAAILAATAMVAGGIRPGVPRELIRSPPCDKREGEMSARVSG